MHYQLKTQQLLTYSRIRMYRAFLERLAADQNVRTNGESHLFYFMMLATIKISEKNADKAVKKQEENSEE